MTGLVESILSQEHFARCRYQCFVRRTTSRGFIPLKTSSLFHATQFTGTLSPLQTLNQECLWGKICPVRLLTRPASISKRSVPRDHQSTARPWPLPLNTSGAACSQRDRSSIYLIYGRATKQIASFPDSLPGQSPVALNSTWLLVPFKFTDPTDDAIFGPELVRNRKGRRCC